MLDFNKIKTLPLKDRENKFNIEDIINIETSTILTNNQNLKKLAKKIKLAKQNHKQCILLMGAHPIKLGLSNFIIDLLRKKILTHIALNGAGPIHDFELAYNGATSEDVEKNLKDGSFGMAEETGRYINLAAKKAQKNKTGLGYEVGKLISDLNCKYKDKSILYNTFKLNTPTTVHTAIGTEIIYQHPECDGAALGTSSYTDFKILTNSISKLEKGVIINLGSAVILPEVFLKGLAISRNLKCIVEDFTSANMDMIDHYRPRVNIVHRPTSLKGEGLTIIEKHEKSIPTLHHLLTKSRQ